jgi:hypothetical protein
MGVSLGGMIVQQLAIDHPERLLSMTSVMSTMGEQDVGQASPEALALLTGPPAPIVPPPSRGTRSYIASPGARLTTTPTVSPSWPVMPSTAASTRPAWPAR